MDSVKWTLFFGGLCFAVPQTEASPWTVKLPSTVKGLPGSCVVIPCSFNYPDRGMTVTQLTGMWLSDTNGLIYHPEQSKTMEQYRSRTQLVGDLTHKSCSLKIDPLQESDRGPFHFRIEIGGHDKYSYKEKKVSIAMISELSDISLSLKEEVTEGQNVSASCSVSHSCPASPPVFTWSFSGEAHVQPQQLEDGQWRATSTLTFRPTRADHNKQLECTIRYHGGRHHKKSKVLIVKYAPHVKVEYKSDVKEGEAVHLKCSSDANPPASSYEWQNESGARLHQGNIFMLPNVSRQHTGALYCTATNAIGQHKSSPVQLNVLYAPEVKTMSSCSSETDMVKCVCIVESKPPSRVYFMLSDKVLPSTKVENHGSLTIGTLQADLGSYASVLCLASNTQGNASLSLPVNSKMQSYILMAVGAGLGMTMLILLIAAGVKKCRGRSGQAPTSHMSTVVADKNVDLPVYALRKRRETSYEDVHCPDMYPDDPVYGNMENDWDDAIYANV